MLRLAQPGPATTWHSLLDYRASGQDPQPRRAWASSPSSLLGSISPGNSQKSPVAPGKLRLHLTLLPSKGPGVQSAPGTACTYSSPLVSSRDTCMISCCASRLVCPFSSLDHLLGLQNGTAHTMSATPASLTAMPVLMLLLLLCLLFHASSNSNTLLKPWDHGGTSSPGLRHNKIPLMVLLHSVGLLLHYGLCRSVGSWGCSRKAGQPARLRVSRPPTHPWEVWPLHRGLLGAWTWIT